MMTAANEPEVVPPPAPDAVPSPVQPVQPVPDPTPPPAERPPEPPPPQPQPPPIEPDKPASWKRAALQFEPVDLMTMQLAQERTMRIEREIDVLLEREGLAAKLRAALKVRNDTFERLVSDYGLAREDSVDLDTGAITRVRPPLSAVS